MLQANMKQLFESKTKVAAIGAPDAQIVFVRVPYLQHEQILFRKNFRQYLETIMLSSKVLRMGIQKNPYQKKHTNYKQGLRDLPWTLRVVIDNLIGSKYLCSTVKAINL